MTLVDTSIWICDVRKGNERLQYLLRRDQVRCHPFVIGELACGNLKRREEILSLLMAVPAVHLAEHHDVLDLIESRRLSGRGLGPFHELHTVDCRPESSNRSRGYWCI